MESLFSQSLKSAAFDNEDYRREYQTTKDSQIVLMKLQEGDSIPREVHQTTTQRLLVCQGKIHVNLFPASGKPMGKWQVVEAGGMVTIPRGYSHAVVNTHEGQTALVSFYAPPVHAKGLVHHTMQEAMAAEENEQAEAY